MKLSLALKYTLKYRTSDEEIKKKIKTVEKQRKIKLRWEQDVQLAQSSLEMKIIGNVSMVQSLSYRLYQKFLPEIKKLSSC